MVSRQLPVGPHREIDWSTGADPSLRPPGERPPNIVLILADDLGWNDLSFGGGGVAGGTVPTPNIDSIAAEGVSFSNGYAGNATCAPSRAALLSGRYGTRFGFEFTPTPAPMAILVPRLGTPVSRLRRPILHDDVPFVEYGAMGMPASEITIAELLSAQGYHTVHIGKWHLGTEHGMAPHEQSFDESLLMESGLYLPQDYADVVNAKQAFDPIDRVLWAAARYAVSFNGSKAFEPRGYLTDYFTEQAVEVIEANKDRPFFLYLAHWAPHTPLQATREDYEALSHIKLHRERVYAAMIRALDRGVGRVDLVPFVRGEAQGVPHRALFWRSGASRSALVDGWKPRNPHGELIEASTGKAGISLEPMESHDYEALPLPEGVVPVDLGITAMDEHWFTRYPD